jgi:hypothetical protein
LVRGARYIQPVFTRQFVIADYAADALVEDFGATSGL